MIAGQMSNVDFDVFSAVFSFVHKFSKRKIVTSFMQYFFTRVCVCHASFVLRIYTCILHMGGVAADW